MKLPQSKTTIDTTPKISVIIPVYNVEPYLRQCLDSVINQTLKEIEIICVDDGSTDNCSQILDQYTKSDNRIKVIHKENGGLSSARNVGLEYVSAPYVYFVDSDDWIKLNCLEKLYDRIIKTNADICITGLMCFDNQTQEYTHNPYFDVDNYKFITTDTCNYKDLHDAIFDRVGVFFKLYKTDFLNKHHIRFPLKVRYEDVVVHIKTMILANKIAFVDENLYIYRINRNNSIMGLSSDLGILPDIYKFMLDSRNFLVEQGKFDELLPYYNQFIANQFAYYSTRMSSTDINKFWKKIFSFLKENNFSEEVEEKLKVCQRQQLKLNISHFKLFFFLPLLSIKETAYKKVYKIFGLPVFKYKQKPGVLSFTYSILGLPVWKFKQKATGTKKYYLFGFLPFLKISHK